MGYVLHLRLCTDNFLSGRSPRGVAEKLDTKRVSGAVFFYRDKNGAGFRSPRSSFVIACY